MKLAISNIAWNDNHDYYYQLMQLYGFTGLEIAPTRFSANPYANLAVAKRVKQELLSKYKLSVVSMQSLLFGTDGLALFTTTEARTNLTDYLKKAIIYAELIECPVLVFGNPKNRIMSDLANDYQLAVEFFKELGEFAKQHNTCLCIEPNPKEYGTNFINTLSETNELVNEVQSDGFAMIIDSSTMIINQDQPEFDVEILKNTKHIHLSMPFLKPLNHEFTTNETWVKQFLNHIQSSDYKRYVSIEMANATQKDIAASLNLLNHLVSPQ